MQFKVRKTYIYRVYKQHWGDLRPQGCPKDRSIVKKFESQFGTEDKLRVMICWGILLPTFSKQIIVDWSKLWEILKSTTETSEKGKKKKKTKETR